MQTLMISQVFIMFHYSPSVKLFTSIQKVLMRYVTDNIRDTRVRFNVAHCF